MGKRPRRCGLASSSHCSSSADDLSAAEGGSSRGSSPFVSTGGPLSLTAGENGRKESVIDQLIGLERRRREEAEARLARTRKRRKSGVLTEDDEIELHLGPAACFPPAHSSGMLTFDVEGEVLLSQ